MGFEGGWGYGVLRIQSVSRQEKNSSVSRDTKGVRSLQDAPPKKLFSSGTDLHHQIILMLKEVKGRLPTLLLT